VAAHALDHRADRRRALVGGNDGTEIAAHVRLGKRSPL
jgi:hypothetical protein